MNTKIFVLMLVILCLTNAVSFADRQLDRTEILHILKSLTTEPHKTWIPAGIITATHEEYKAVTTRNPNESKSTTNVTVRLDGERFYWQIDVVSCTNSNVTNNITEEQLNLNANGSRIFAWDGQKYSAYFRPTNNAVIKDAAKLRIPCVVNGPLTAGFIPWGYGNYAYEKLSTTVSSAIESAIEGQNQIQLTLNHPSGLQMAFSVDPNKNYAVLSHVVKKANSSVTVNTYGSFLRVGNRWIPTTILIEQYKDFVTEQNLVSSDLWNFTSVSGSIPSEDSFKVNYETDALIEYHNALTDKSLMYRYSKVAPASNWVDTDELLIDKLTSDAAGTSQSQNCATAAMKYAISKLGKTVTDQQLAQLMPASGQSTSLYAMKQFAQGVGLYCRAVRTEVPILKGLNDCQAVLHIPDTNHYVVLGNIDDAYVRTIDLTSRKFFDRIKIEEFGEEWQGTALLISSKPIAVQGTLTDIDDAVLQNIVGSGGFACNKLLQGYDVIGCSSPVGGECGGTYREYPERWGCVKSTSGTCGTTILIKYQELHCVEDPYVPGTCTTTGDWIPHYMKACL